MLQVHTEEVKGFTISLFIEQETFKPDWDFSSEEEKQQLLCKIDNGSVLWFCAKVTANKCGIELSSDYLGGCCYNTIEDFIKDDYYQEMVDTVIQAANDKIFELINN